jgi:hypothetical protein
MCHPLRDSDRKGKKTFRKNASSLRSLAKKKRLSPFYPPFRPLLAPFQAFFTTISAAVSAA